MFFYFKNPDLENPDLEKNPELKSTLTLDSFVNNKNLKVDSLKFVKKEAKKEFNAGKGSINNWGINQKKYIVYIISESLLKTQQKITNVKINILELINQVQKCLMCLVQNFSEKYEYSFIINHITNIGKDINFDKWFKNLYNTCDCNDQLGKLLLTLLKQYWKQTVLNKCPDISSSDIGSCIDKIKYNGFSQESINLQTLEIEECVQLYCPLLIK
jgi:hypothetical protein